MKQFLLLIRQQIKYMFLSNSTRRKYPLLFAVILPVALMLYLSVTYVYGMLQILPPDKYYYIPYIFSLGASTFILMTAVSSKGYLFGFKDFDLLMSLPIRKEAIMMSKFIGFILLQYFYMFLILSPALIVYGIIAGMDISYYFLVFTGLPFMPLYVILISMLVGIMIKFISGKSKYEKIISNILSLVFFAGLFIASFSIQNISEVEAYNKLGSLVNFVKAYIPTIYFFVNGAINANILHWVLNIVINLILVILAILIFSKLFISLNAKGEEGYKVRNYKINKINLNSKKFTLFKKELFKFFSNIQYVINMSLGSILVLIGAIYLAFNKSLLTMILYQATNISEFTSVIPFIVLVAIGGISHMTCTTCVSISLEGKHLWISKSLPVSVEDIFISKALVNIILIVIPSLLSFILLMFAFNMPIYWLFISIVYIILVSLFVSMVGLVINLLFPKLDFDREIIVIKQSMASFIGVMLNIIIGMGSITFFFAFADKYSLVMLLSLFTTFYLLSSICLYIYLKTWGVKRFINL